MMHIIAGLGNPGTKYYGTRHNTGFEVVDRLSERYSIPMDYEKHSAVCGKGIIEGQRVLLVKPVTFMNLSGNSIQQIVAFYKEDPSESLIVVSDDIELDVGRIRVRPNGSAGGHNGLKDIIGKLGNGNFARVRVGVGRKPAQWDLADWVLSRFAPEDGKIMEESEELAAKAVVSILTDGVDRAMSLYNGRNLAAGEEKKEKEKK